ncbi:hypothetical protein LPJ66_007328 [Kickxella alabastrina]|uniref:Uncharacterized protein n=1 Tax=Kickxella alabastrina TaxID=61397 RepID=A0ACC1IBH2_9FUNG|nr:hypothetical protein LPJ66_007328 [Kickxella alabastrina]
MKDPSAYAKLPFEVLDLICHMSDRQTLNSLQHVSRVWRQLSLPLLWKSIDISDWEYRASADRVHAVYGRLVHTMEYRRCQRRRGNSHSSSAPASPQAVSGKTKTDILCEWLGMRWKNVRRVAIGAWPPYNIRRVQQVLATCNPQLRVLILEGAAAAWAETMQRAVTAHPHLQGLHITEDNRALLPPAADEHYKRSQVRFLFLSNGAGASLTQLTVPCIVESAVQLLGQLSDLLPLLQTLDLRQVDAGAASKLSINLPPMLRHLKISGQYPLSMRMFGHPHGKATASALMAASLHSLSVTGLRSEEAAWRESDTFWTPILQHKWALLTGLVIPVARPELSLLIGTNCSKLERLQFIYAGSSINQQQNNLWATKLTCLPQLRHLDIASSNNEYEGCSLSSRLVTGCIWKTQWLHSLYVSRLSLSTDALSALLRMLPYLHTLWFTFDAKPRTNDSLEQIGIDCRPVTQCRLQYLIIHAVITRDCNRSAAYTSESDSEQTGSGPTNILSACLVGLPSVNKCRLPMFTFPDEQRHWLQCQFPRINFKKYAPPY